MVIGHLYAFYQETWEYLSILRPMRPSFVGNSLFFLKENEIDEYFRVLQQHIYCWKFCEQHFQVFYKDGSKNSDTLWNIALCTSCIHAYEFD